LKKALLTEQVTDSKNICSFTETKVMLMKYILGTLTLLLALLSSSSIMASDRVVVVPLGGSAVGDATVTDVIKSKTFSSAVGKGLTGTLECHSYACYPSEPCYTFAPETRNVGTCSDGKFQLNPKSNQCNCIEETGPRTEICNGHDDNCNGSVTDEDSSCLCSVGEERFEECGTYGSVDICKGIRDGTYIYCCGTSEITEGAYGCYRGIGTDFRLDAIDDDSDGFSTPEDCNDENPNIYPWAVELCNGYDDDCDYLIDESCI
jgi:hypothetical protein